MNGIIEALEERLVRQALLLETIADLIKEDPDEAAATFIGAASAVLAQAYPASFSKDTVHEIQMTHPGATEADISKNAMSEVGVLTSIALNTLATRNAMDYHPTSYFPDEVIDPEREKVAVSSLVDSVNDLFLKAQQSGLSTLGTAVIAINAGVSMAHTQGLPKLLILRVLMEAVEVALLYDTQGESFTDVVERIAIEMGIAPEDAMAMFEQGPKKNGPHLH